ncbi:uncharacterized protein K452DRAFT_288551 [Aplosporella prunicola CBS 121167]|uniref:Serine/threonine-protein phosphatase 2A activator n=1 Tax=Aplosporella prunicola CBS 121167 TaxID=1176127 RepID=A0A6A6BC31_9PEZI|nr:uncharacterized protein K452DRAFT_288551 [Aplosporella prunicola CBS 121167]KAF2140467.1 hypothetical protein K452DRAFT_288551 [Aplosporella prunicola CBS 121167]
MSSTTANIPPHAHPPNLSDKLPRLGSPRKTTRTPPESPIPAPPTPALPPPPSLTNWTFQTPSRRILTPHDHALFQASPTYTLLLAFVFHLSDSARGTPMRAVARETPARGVAGVLAVLDAAEEVLRANPPEDAGGSRFGNKAFRGFVGGVSAASAGWHAEMLGVKDAEAAEAGAYLCASFGNAARIDYGSGHELNFVLWLLCQYQLGLLDGTAFAQLALRVFPRYLRLMRAVQTAYYLEPAGSHGVWGLDDYQFLPFLIGAAQLAGHRYIRPKSIHSAAVLEEAAPDYLYFEQVAFVNSVKNVEGLRWHSPMLDDISAARSWDKIEAGMRKMFVREVLGKLPVMQHFLFGSLVPAVEGMSAEDEAEQGGDGEDGDADAHAGHSHGHGEEGVNSWGDCCGIKVPSSVGAAQEMKKRMGTEGLRRLPFD